MIRYCSFLLTLSVLLGACTKEIGCRDKNAINYSPTAEVADASCLYPSIDITIDLNWGSTDFEINRIYNLNGHNMAIKVFQCYLSNFKYQFADSTTLRPSNRYHLLKKDEQKISLGVLERTEITNLSMLAGIDSASNAQIATYLMDPLHPLRLQTPDTMHHNVNDGYIFIKLSGKVDRNGDGIPNENESFVFNVGSDSLLRKLVFPLNKTLTQENETIALELDVLQLFNNIDLQTEQSTNTFDNPTLAQKITNNFSTAISVK